MSKSPAAGRALRNALAEFKCVEEPQEARRIDFSRCPCGQIIPVPAEAAPTAP